MPDISNRIIKPKDCVLAFGIPTSKKGFTNADSDFVRKYNGSWLRYDYEIVSNVNVIKPAITGLGVTVVHDLTLRHFAALFAGRRFAVVILFSHWKNDTVEFCDGLVDIPTVVECIPTNFSGIIDVCVCHPIKLVIALEEHRPHCLRKFITKETTPHLWLYFYLNLFERLYYRDLTYLRALEDTSSD